MASEPYFTREESGLLSQLEIGFRTLSRRYHLVREPAQVAPECLHKNVRDLGVRLDALQRHRHGALGAVRGNAERWSHSEPAASPKQAIIAPAATAARIISILVTFRKVIVCLSTNAQIIQRTNHLTPNHHVGSCGTVVSGVELSITWRALKRALAETILALGPSC